MAENKTDVTKDEKKVPWVGLAVLVAVSLLFVAGVTWYSYLLSAPDTPLNTDYYALGGEALMPRDTQRIMSSLSDGFFIIGVLLAGVGCLTWISNTGFFDMLTYGFHGLKVLIMPFKAPKKAKPFYDYKLEREEKRKKPLNLVLWVGLAYLGLAALFAMIYYNV